MKFSFLLNASLPYATPISITEVLRLAANVKLFKTTLLWNKELIYHYFSLLWQKLTMRFITNCDHAHLSESMKNDATISITCMRLWAFCDYALGAETHIVQFADKSNCKKLCSTWGSYLDQHSPGGFSSMQLLESKILKDKLAYKIFCSILQYTIKSKETRIKNKFWI